MQLTYSEAIEQGYTRYIYAHGGFQTAYLLNDAGEIQWHREIELVEKESYHPKGIDAEDIIEFIADTIESNHGNDTGDDTERVYKTLKAINPAVCQPLIDEINARLASLHYFEGSGITLVRDEY